MRGRHIPPKKGCERRKGPPRDPRNCRYRGPRWGDEGRRGGGEKVISTHRQRRTRDRPQAAPLRSASTEAKGGVARRAGGCGGGADHSRGGKSGSEEGDNAPHPQRGPPPPASFSTVEQSERSREGEKQGGRRGRRGGSLGEGSLPLSQSGTTQTPWQSCGDESNRARRKGGWGRHELIAEGRRGPRMRATLRPASPAGSGPERRQRRRATLPPPLFPAFPRL